MRAQNWLILLLWGCCLALDRWLGLDQTADSGVQYSWIGALISGIASAASGIAGSISANNRRSQAEQLLKERKKELREWRDAEMGSNFLDRADSRAALRRVFENNKKAQKATDTNAIKRGLTDEAKVAQASKLNENYADVVSQIAGAGARHKDRVQQMYLGETRGLDNLKIQSLMDTSGVDNMVQGLAGAASGLGTVLSGDVSGAPREVKSTPVEISPKLKAMAENGVGIPKNYKIKL